MKAMVLAAGLGTRLRPLTEHRPKALVEVAGRTLLEITLARLRAFGVTDVIVNAHHFAEQIVDYLRANRNFGMRIAVSREQELLDTGGGLKRAAWFFLEGPDEPFFLHNVDVLSTIDLGRMLQFHHERQPLATLAVQHRHSSRCLLFDSELQLCGRRAGNDLAPEMIRPTEQVEPLAFCGIHVISPRIFSEMRQDGIFSIIPAYLDLTARGEKIIAFRADDYYWQDLGTPEHVHQAAREIKDKVLL